MSYYVCMSYVHEMFLPQDCQEHSIFNFLDHMSKLFFQLYLLSENTSLDRRSLKYCVLF